jgi:hypothetical protein
LKLGREAIFKDVRKRRSDPDSAVNNQPVTGRYSKSYLIFEANLLIGRGGHTVTMGLSEIAAGLELRTEQVQRGVATVDDTDVDLDARLREYEADLPCTAAAASTVLERYDEGASVGDAGEAAALAPVTAAKLLHRCGFEGVSPTARRVLRDWIDGRLSRADALELTSSDEAEFALAAYVETHEPIAELAEAVRRDASAPIAGDALVSKRDALAETMTGSADLR